MIDVTAIEKRIDQAIAAPIPVNAELGGLTLENMGQVMEFAKLMAVSGAAVPKYLRGNPGACLAICTRALRWGMDPFAVAEKSYMVMNRGEERVAFEAQLIHAVVTSRAPLQSRLRYEIVGEGDERRCKVWGTFRGETEPHTYTSETLGRLREARGRNDHGVLRGSPLWEAQPEVQIAYSAVRQWARLFASETLLGVYTPDEFEDAQPVDVTPKQDEFLERLYAARKAQGTRGFNSDLVHSVIEGSANEKGVSEPARDTIQSGDDQHPGRDLHESGGGGSDSGDQNEGNLLADASPTKVIKPKPEGKRKL